MEQIEVLCKGKLRVEYNQDNCRVMYALNDIALTIRTIPNKDLPELIQYIEKLPIPILDDIFKAHSSK